MKTVEEVRHARLSELKQRFKTLAAINTAIGRLPTDSTLSQILNRSLNSKTGSPKVMGSTQAREIEVALKLEVGWMDTDQDLLDLAYQGKPEAQSNGIDSLSTKVNSDAPPIPVTAMFNHVNLTSTILLMGHLLGCMDQRSRRVMGVLLADLAEAPDEAQDVADKASGLFQRQRPVTQNAELDKAIKGDSSKTVETQPAPLSSK